MNWIGRLFGKKESLPPIRLEELPLWLDTRAEKISEGIGRQASSVYSDIEGALAQIKESTAQLQEAEPEGRFHLKMVKLATTNRDNMARQVRMLLENITIPKASDVKSVVSFHENAVQTLTVCLENMMKSYQYTKLVFLEESKQVIADVNALGRLLNQLIEPLNSRKNVLVAIENARSLIKSLKNIRSDIELGEKTITEHEERISHLQKELEEKQNAIARLRESESWKQYNGYKDELALLENNAGKKEAEIKNLIAPLNKAMNRLKQLSDSGKYTLKPEIREGLNLCLSDPLNVPYGFFAEFENIAASGVLNLNPERTNKLLEQVKIVASSLELYKEEYQALVKDIERKKKEISGMDIAREEADLTRGVSAVREKLAGLESELGISKNQVASLKNNLELKMLELQQNISIMDGKIRIV